uniref:Sperm associated antigen 17 n=1 Tax=Echeneis naucrates TaxID=173247 RepID=A0A665XGI1_ECHNA
MPTKAGKRGSAKKPHAAGGTNNWELGLIRAQFEESWRACVSFVVGTSQEDEKLIEALTLAVQQPQRRLFSLLTWDKPSLSLQIHEFGNPKAKKPDDVPIFYEVTEPAKTLLDAGEEIPCDLMAKILKCLLLQIKANDQQRREAEQAVDEKAKTSPVSSSKEKGAAKISDKKGTSPPSPEGSSKQKTKLKRRDDVEPPKFIDDEPDDGPQHYILVLGFYQPNLIVALDAVGVHVANVIKLCSVHKGSYVVQQQHCISEGCEQTSTSEERVAQGRRLDLFWSGLRPVLDTAPQDSKLHNVAQLSYIVQDLLLSCHPQDPEAVLQLGSQIFEGVARLIYDCLDCRRQHQHYLENVRFINVPVALDSQVRVVLRNVLQTITVREQCHQLLRPKNIWNLTKEQFELPPVPTDVDMRHYNNLLNLIPAEACSVPIILHCMLEQVCLCLLDIYDVSWPEVVRLFHQSVFEALPLTRLDQKGVLQNAAGPYGTLGAAQEQTPIIPWDDPLSYAKQQFHNLRTKGPLCAVLQIAAKEYCCLDTFKGSHNNSLYIYCHNPMSPHLQSEEHWDVTLHTDVKFRSDSKIPIRGLLPTDMDSIVCVGFFYAEQKMIIHCQLNRARLTDSDPKSPKLNHYFVLPHTLTAVYITTWLMSQAWKLEQEKLKEEEVAKNSKKETPKSKQRKEEAKSADNKNSKGLSGGKRSRAETRGNSTKSLTELNPTTVFVGYNMDGKLIHVSGCVRYLFPSDGGQITVENVHFIEGKETTLRLKRNFQIVFKSTIKILTSKQNQAIISSETISKQSIKVKSKAVEMKRVRQGSLSAVLNNGIHLSYSFHGPTGEYIGKTHKIFSLCEVTSCISDQGMLVRQSFPLHDGEDLGQLQDPSLSKELSRTVTSQGTVIRYMRDGSTEVHLHAHTYSYRSTQCHTFHVSILFAFKDQILDEEADSQKGCWLTTTPSGERICTVGSTHERIPTTPLLTFKATDPITHQVVLSREDLVVYVQNPDGSLTVDYADGTRITSLYQDRTTNTGCYKYNWQPNIIFSFLNKVCPSNVGILEIQSDGKCVYSSDPHVNASTESGTRANQPGSYTMSHADKVACDVTDPDGNHFQVGYQEGLVLKYISCSRLFLIHEDGTGTEMLSSQTVEELLNQAYSDPTIALLNEPLPDTQGALEFCITILKPSHQSVWSQWILGKQNPDIIPPNLRDRSWHDFPRVEKKSPGPPFGTSMGRSLTLTERSGDRTAQHQPVRSCPKVLEMRKLYQHRPVDKLLMEREQRSEEMKVKDPRTEEECARASDLMSMPSCVSLPGESSLRSSSGPYKSVQVDVTGKPRRTKVRLPYSILSSKPCSVPNQQVYKYLVRRKCRTISLTNPHAVVRGFQLFPSIVDFGTLQEGTTSTIMVLMKNVGIDSCRFHVKQPPPATGLRVIYNPGPVAAGLRVELQVQLFAMCAAKTGEVEPKKCISQEIVIHTEKDIFYLPVTEDVLNQKHSKNLPEEHPNDTISR